MRFFLRVALALAFAVGPACSDDSTRSTADPGRGPGARDDGGKEAAAGDAGPGSNDGAPEDDAALGPTTTFRVMAANISSGAASTYDSGEGIRIFQGLKPDVALIQELNYETNSDADLDDFVTKAFGAGFQRAVESGGSGRIPNGVVSRFPIVTSGHWTDPKVSNRSFVYAKIGVPGAHPLWAISVHLLTTEETDRNAEAAALTAEIEKVAAAGDYVVIGGDLNTDDRTESCLTTFEAVVDTTVIPVDQDGNDFTSGPRTRPYDWVLPSPSLGEHQAPTVVGSSSFPTGLVFDSRVYTPLADVAPVMKDDCDAVNMQHMAVVKDFAIPNRD